MKLCTIIICMVKVGKLRHREVEILAQVHIANWQVGPTHCSGSLFPSKRDVRASLAHVANHGLRDFLLEQHQKEQL